MGSCTILEREKKAFKFGKLKLKFWIEKTKTKNL